MIDKDLGNIYNGMIKATYVPVIRRAIVILLIHDMDRMQAGLKVGDEQFFDMLQGPSAKKVLYQCLDAIYRRRGDIIQEILLQYGIDTHPSMTSFYHEHFGAHFGKIIEDIKRWIHSGRYAMLDYYAKIQPE